MCFREDHSNLGPRPTAKKDIIRLITSRWCTSFLRAIKKTVHVPSRRTQMKIKLYFLPLEMLLSTERPETNMTGKESWGLSPFLNFTLRKREGKT